MHRTHAKSITVDDLPEPCRSCLFWETGGPPGSETPPSRRARDRDAKQSWWHATELEWGTFALGLREGEELIGYAVVTTPSYLEGAASIGRVSDDALLMAVLWTADGVDDADSVAASLVESALALAVAHDASALEAFGASRGGPDCVPDEALLRRRGFRLLHGGFPYRHYRLDVRSTARLRDGVEEAAAYVRRLVRRTRLGRVPSMPTSSR